MAPKAIGFSWDQVGTSALDLVREIGWDSLSALNVAERLGSSVTPVYRAFGSMESIEGFVLAAAVAKLEAMVARNFAPGAFLSRGVGLAVFAREEPSLFLALYRAGKMCTYTIGTAIAMIYGYSADPSTESVMTDLRETGASIIYGELSGIAMKEDKETKAAWAIVLGEIPIRE